jgi:hypothetical protein
MTLNNEEKSARVTIIVSEDEARLLTVALGNCVEFIDDWEFETVMGFSKDETMALFSKLKDVRKLNR